MKRRRKHKRLKIILAIISLLLIGLLTFFQRNITKILISISEATIRSITTVAVNDAIYYTLNDSLRYEDLIHITYDAAGDVSTITTDSLKINKIACNFKAVKTEVYNVKAKFSIHRNYKYLSYFNYIYKFCHK